MPAVEQDYGRPGKHVKPSESNIPRDDSDPPTNEDSALLGSPCVDKPNQIADGDDFESHTPWVPSLTAPAQDQPQHTAPIPDRPAVGKKNRSRIKRKQVTTSPSPSSHEKLADEIGRSEFTDKRRKLSEQKDNMIKAASAGASAPEKEGTSSALIEDRERIVERLPTDVEEGEDDLTALTTAALIDQCGEEVMGGSPSNSIDESNDLGSKARESSLTISSPQSSDDSQRPIGSKAKATKARQKAKRTSEKQSRRQDGRERDEDASASEGEKAQAVREHGGNRFDDDEGEAGINAGDDTVYERGWSGADSQDGNGERARGKARRGAAAKRKKGKKGKRPARQPDEEGDEAQ